MEFPGVSPKPSLYDLSMYNFILKKPINDIWELFIKYFEENVEWKFKYKIMQCKTVCLLDIIHFDIKIFKYDEGSFIIEFRHMQGCRYSFSQFINTIEKELQISLTEKHYINKCPPDIPDDLYEQHMIQNYNYLHYLTNADNFIEDRINGYRMFGSMKMRYSTEDGNVKNINLETKELLTLIREAIMISKSINENNDLRIIVVASLNNFINFCKEYSQTPTWLIELKETYNILNNEVNKETPLLQFEIKKGSRMFD